MSATRLEYHEIMQVFADEAEPVSTRVVSKLADLAKEKAETMHQQAYEEGYRDGFDQAVEGK
jgi:flagellar biosynthesis/type III secretory pathway protein FliH